LDASDFRGDKINSAYKVATKLGRVAALIVSNVEQVKSERLKREMESGGMIAIESTDGLCTAGCGFVVHAGASWRLQTSLVDAISEID
jgi:hypothetical protein